MKLDKLEKLYVHELKDLYSAERQVADALPALIDASGDEGLVQVLRAHLDETKTHISRIETIFRELEYEPGGHHCKGMEGLILEARDALKDVPASEAEVRDALIIAGCQRIEHYEIAAYGIARAYAEQLGAQQAADLLTLSIEEEGEADRSLSRLAARRIIFEALATR